MEDDEDQARVRAQARDDLIMDLFIQAGPDGKSAACSSDAMFTEVLATFPDAPVTFEVHGYTHDCIVERVVVHLPNEQDIPEGGSAYMDLVHVPTFFPELKGWRTLEECAIAISAQHFIDDCQRLSAMMGRKLTISRREATD